MNATMRYVLAVVGTAAVLMLGATAQVVHEGNCSPVQIEESVIFHASNSLDVGDIEEALTMSPPDFELAREIYTVGKNAPYTKSPTGLRSLQFMSTKDLSAEPLAAGFVKLYDSITWMDDYMMAALNGTGEFEGKSDELRAMAAMKNAVAILTVFSDHEVEVALAQAAGGSALNAPKIDSNSTNIHWDEYFAFYYGLTGVDSPAEVSMERDADFGTSIMMRALDDFSVGRTAALMTDFSGIRAAQRSITAGYLITFLQSTLKYAYQLQSGQGGDAEWAGAYTSWRTMSGAIAAEDMEAAQRIESMLSLSAGSIDQLDPNVYCGVKAEIEAVLPVMGVQMIDMGNLSEDNGNGILIGADACSTELNGA